MGSSSSSRATPRPKNKTRGNVSNFPRHREADYRILFQANLVLPWQTKLTRYVLARPEVTGKSIAGQLADALADGG
jgi:hypothetical protein